MICSFPITLSSRGNPEKQPAGSRAERFSRDAYGGHPFDASLENREGASLRV